MKNFELVQTERRAVMEKIAKGLQEVKDKVVRRIEDTAGYVEPIVTIPVLVMNLPIEYHDEENRCGFAVTVCQQTFKPVAASWYRANGVSTYRESKLTDEELEDLKAYYWKNLKGLWTVFCDTVMD